MQHSSFRGGGTLCKDLNNGCVVDLITSHSCSVSVAAVSIHKSIGKSKKEGEEINGDKCKIVNSKRFLTYKPLLL